MKMSEEDGENNKSLSKQDQESHLSGEEFYLCLW